MSYVARCAQIARHVGSFVLHFAHGGIVMAGVLIIALLGYQVSLNGTAGLDPARLFVFERVEEPVVGEFLKPEMALTAEGKLSPEMMRVAQHVSRRFRVSTLVVEPLLLTAIREGQANNVDPLLIVAVASIESSFNPLAESVLGAQGLMQIIPRFHTDKISGDKGHMALFDPVENIRVGSRILRDYVRARGSLELGLQQYGGAPNDAEMIYANKVLAEWARLQQVMKFGTPKAVATESSGDKPRQPAAVDADGAEPAG